MEGAGNEDWRSLPPGMVAPPPAPSEAAPAPVAMEMAPVPGVAPPPPPPPPPGAPAPAPAATPATDPPAATVTGEVELPPAPTLPQGRDVVAVAADVSVASAPSLPPPPAPAAGPTAPPEPLSPQPILPPAPASAPTSGLPPATPVMVNEQDEAAVADDGTLTLDTFAIPSTGRHRSATELFGEPDADALAAVEALLSPVTAELADEVNHLAWLSSHLEAGRLDRGSWERIVEHEGGGLASPEAHQAAAPSPAELAEGGWQGSLIGAAALILSLVLYAGFWSLGWFVDTTLGGDDPAGGVGSVPTDPAAWAYTGAFAFLTLVAIVLILAPLRGQAKRLGQEAGLMLATAGGVTAWFTTLAELDVGGPESVAWIPTAVIVAAFLLWSRLTPAKVAPVLIALAALVPLFQAILVTETATWRFGSLAVMWALIVADLGVGFWRGTSPRPVTHAQIVLGLIAGGFGWLLALAGAEVVADAETDRWIAAFLAGISGLFGLIIVAGWPALLRSGDPAGPDRNHWPTLALMLPLIITPLIVGMNLAEIDRLGLPATIGNDTVTMSTMWPIAIAGQFVAAALTATGNPFGRYWRRPGRGGRSRITAVTLHLVLTVIWIISAIVDVLAGGSVFVLLPLGVVTMGVLLWRLGRSKPPTPALGEAPAAALAP